MTRRLLPGRLVVASHNRGKIVEIAELVAPFGVTPVSAADLGLPEPEETGSTFAANAELKARASALATGLPALADDSGLSVAALGGDPGIYSARWAGETRDFTLAMQKVEEALQAAGATTAPLRRAHFTCALSLAWPDGEILTVEGEVHGRLVWPPRGGNGFGYDAVFLADGQSETFGEMEPAAKHALSHRARAIALLKAACLDGDV